MQRYMNDRSSRIHQERDLRSNILKGKKEPLHILEHDHNPLDNVTCRIGDNTCAAKHVSVMQRTEMFHPMNESHRVQSLMDLQQKYGNRFVQKIITQQTIQAKLKVGQTGDIYEQEADRVANAVMQMPEPNVSKREKGFDRIQRSCSTYEDILHDKSKEQKKQVSDTIPSVGSGFNNMAGNSQPLQPSDRAFFESRFGYDFGQVQVHTDVSGTSQSKGILAYTIGNHIVFGKGRYAPNTTEGKFLLAHELAHVIQQQSVPPVQQFGSSGESANYEGNQNIMNYHSNIMNYHSMVKLTTTTKLPQFGIIGCMWYMWRFSRLINQCQNEFKEACSDDLLSDECQEFMDGAGFPSDAILRCVGRKNPEAMAKLLSSCSTVSLGRLLRR